MSDQNPHYPLDGNPHVYQEFGINDHVGKDWDVVPETPVRACLNGKAYLVVQDSKVYGRFIALLHDDGYASWYAHLSKTLIKKGDYVLGGTVIGLSGGAVGSDGAGQTTGWHLHFEVRVPGHLDHNAYNVDPIKYIESYMVESGEEPKEEFICYAEDKVYEPKGDLQPITICSDCYYRMSKADDEIDTLRKQLEIVWDGLDDIIVMELPDEIHKLARDLMDKIERIGGNE